MVMNQIHNQDIYQLDKDQHQILCGCIIAPIIPTACNNAFLLQPLQYGNAEPMTISLISAITPHCISDSILPGSRYAIDINKPGPITIRKTETKMY
ncbi:hypothetical protein DERP_005169 [Dermatophagoides pteronyssinus]|uniref:Uncharacterized protein n=1 Tax=Dermatophagoides pteronyssinus TaxID=6956 RepID=A0ABQ8JLU6_DERPT|nr:hypothetical protein DERP_005169 [Dermatophagoides pteronyssinus]